MAIINCPHCGKPTSSVAKACRSCVAALNSADHEQNARLAARTRREQARRMASQAVLATLLGVSGGLWLIFGDAPHHNAIARMLALAMLVGGLAWYLYLRVRLWLHKRP